MPESVSSKNTPSEISLTLLATTDVHAHLLAYDYYSDQPSPKKPSLARLASLIAEERAHSPNVLLVDNGDFLQGTPLADLFGDLSPPDAVSHPVIDAMNYLNYDAASLGNHEFNTPLSQLHSILQGLRCPLLCANLNPIGEGASLLNGLWQGQVILDRQLLDQMGNRHTVRIGLFGVLPPQVLSWDYSRVSGRLAATDSIQAARTSVRELREKGADIVIALGHTGLSSKPEEKNMENSGLYIAGIDGIDALVLGHSHLAFPQPDQPTHPEIAAQNGTISGVPTVVPGSAAAYLGKINLTLSQNGQSWRVRSHKSEIVSATEPCLIEEDQNFVSSLSPAHEWVLDQIRAPLGEVSFPIHSYLALLPGCGTVRLVAHAQTEYLREKLSGTSLAQLPLLSAAAPQKCGGRSGPGHFTHIPAGPVALRNIADIQFFPNEVSAIRLNGSEIADWLEMSASIYNRIVPDCPDQPLRNDDFPPYNSDTIFGLTYAIDLTQEPRFDPGGAMTNPTSRRAKDIRYLGEPLDPDQTFVVAVNNYRSGGGGGFPHVSPERIAFQSDTKIRDLLAKTLMAPPSRDALPEVPWRFLPIKGATVVFDTGPGIEPFLEGINVPGLDVVGQKPDGFLQMRLSLEP